MLCGGHSARSLFFLVEMTKVVEVVLSVSVLFLWFIACLFGMTIAMIGSYVGRLLGLHLSLVRF